MIGLGFVYALAGLVFAGFALTGLRNRANPRRHANAAFWGLMALGFLAGDRLGDTGNGLLVLALVGVATIGLGRDARPSPAFAGQGGGELAERGGIVDRPSPAIAGEGGDPSRSDGEDEGLLLRPSDRKKALTRPSPAKAGEGFATAPALPGNRLFVPALVVPAVALGGTLLFRHTPALVDPKQATLVALALG